MLILIGVYDVVCHGDGGIASEGVVNAAASVFLAGRTAINPKSSSSYTMRGGSNGTSFFLDAVNSSSMKILLVFLVNSVCLVSLVSSFLLTAPQQTGISNQLVQVRTHRLDASSAWVLKTTIFYPEDDNGPVFDDDMIVLNNELSPEIQKRQEDLAEALTLDQATLAHLASAYSPEGHAIDLKHINSVRCASLDEKHLEIEAILCDDIGCNSLLVPVDYPNECLLNENSSDTSDSSSFEECVVTNVHSLDVDVQTKLFNKKQTDTDAESVYKTLELAARLMKDASAFSAWWEIELCGSEWWTFPETDDDVTECQLLKDLLNGDDMLDVRMDLARQTLNTFAAIHHVEVMEIGQLGMILKIVFVMVESGIVEEFLPMQFAQTDGSIRTKVLSSLSL